MSTRTLPGFDPVQDRDWLNSYLYREFRFAEALVTLEPTALFARMRRPQWRKLQQAWQQHQTTSRILQKQPPAQGLLGGGLLAAQGGLPFANNTGKK